MSSYPSYQCHKVVRAFRVGRIEAHTIFPTDPNLHPFTATAEFIDKHPLNRDGYVVIYEDGYVSWSPADVFEAGYTLIGDPE